MATHDVVRELDDLLRRCVQCGLCLPHCATWLATGNEVQSPRGRLVLLRDTMDAAAVPDPAYLSAFDSCIGCRACVTACPSGVRFELLQRGQALAAGRVPERAILPATIRRRLDRSSWLTALRRFAAPVRSLLRGLLGIRWRQRLPDVGVFRLLGGLPVAPHRDSALVDQLDRLVGRRGSWRFPVAPTDGRGDVLLFRGCANEGLLPGTSARARDLLSWSGYSVVTAAGQECCGALAAHDGRPGRAARLRSANRTTLSAPSAKDVPVVVEAAGCGLELQELGASFASRVVDLTVLLAGAGLPPAGRIDLRVAVHDPCHLRHGQGVTAEPRALLARIPGLTVLEPDEPEVCCGSGGAWGLRYPEMSAALARRKARLFAATGADLVVTTNPGCLGQISDGLALEAPELPILPLSDLVWYASLVR